MTGPRDNRHPSPCDVIVHLLPPEVATAHTQRPGQWSDLLGAEQHGTERMRPQRLAQYAAGRRCAHAALHRLGVGPHAVARDDGARPIWPVGIVGSLTHCDGFAAAATARRSAITLLGIDAEPHAGLPRAVLHRISGPQERHQVDELTERTPQISWSCLLFSAKESAFKAFSQYPGSVREIADVPIALDASGRFDVLPGTPVQTARHAQRLTGRWLLHGPRILTTAFSYAQLPRPACGSGQAPVPAPFPRTPTPHKTRNRYDDR